MQTLRVSSLRRRIRARSRQSFLMCAVAVRAPAMGQRRDATPRGHYARPRGEMARREAAADGRLARATRTSVRISPERPRPSPNGQLEGGREADDRPMLQHVELEPARA